jgi:putative SbcD/Mre11-related phosphoesterase
MMFITGYPALRINDYLVISDLHLGITRELYEKGVSMPSQLSKIIDRIHKIKKISRAKKLVLLGDTKHNIPGISYQELKEIPMFLEKLRFESIILVKGNHDGNIEKLIPASLKSRVKVKKSFVIGDYLLTHGHRNVKTDKNIIMGHNHPHVRFVDKLGAKYIEPCWVMGKYKKRKIILVPTFNELCGASIVNSREKFLGPIAKKIKKSSAKIFLLDGTYLGYIKDLMDDNHGI